jgi:Sec-independent protein translocase protein TatA
MSVRAFQLGCAAAAVLLLLTNGAVCRAQTSVIVVVGAEGAPEFGRQFAAWADRWREAAKQANAKWQEVGRGAASEPTDRQRLQQLLEAESREGTDELWLVLIGHGTSDGRAARFNLRGLDVSDVELAKALEEFHRPLVIVDCSASSGPFINRLSGPGRIVVTATRSGNEQNFARFGDYFSAAFLDRTADFDRDGQVSVLEAFLAGSHRLAEFYRTESRIATEHPLIDDNGDGLGTPGDWFQGLRATKRARDGASLDGHRARQCVLIRSDQERRIPAELRAERDRLELAVAELRDRKESIGDEDEYYARLEEHLIKLAELRERIEARGRESGIGSRQSGKD